MGMQEYVCPRYFDKYIMQNKKKSAIELRNRFFNSPFVKHWNLSKPLLLEKNPWLQMSELFFLLPQPNVQLVIMRHPFFYRNARVNCGPSMKEGDVYEAVTCLWCAISWVGVLKKKKTATYYY